MEQFLSALHAGDVDTARTLLELPGSYRPSTFADPANSFHENAALCRAAENSCFFATAVHLDRGFADHRLVHDCIHRG